MSDPEGVSENHVLIPVINEQLRIEKREVVTGGVRVRKEVKERTEVIDQALASTRVEVEHVPVGKFVDVIPAVRSEGDLTIVPVVEEVAVVQTRLWLREEIHIRRLTVETRAPQQVILRHDEVTIERLSSDQAAALRAEALLDPGTPNAGTPDEQATPVDRAHGRTEI